MEESQIEEIWRDTCMNVEEEKVGRRLISDDIEEVETDW